MWRALRAQGIFRGAGPAPKVAFLYTGQGSQYVNMLDELRQLEPIVAETFAEADRVMDAAPRPAADRLSVRRWQRRGAHAAAEEELRQTAITQPAVLAADVALTRLLAAYGVAPDMVMGHSLGEYGALVAAGCLPFAEALEAVAARGREMTRLSVADNGKMVAVFAPLAEIESVLGGVDGYVVVANINSTAQAVVGGATRRGRGRRRRCSRHAGRDGRAAAGQPRLPHRDRGAGERAAEARCCARLDLRPPRSRSWPTSPAASIPMGDGRRAGDDRSARPPDRLARAVRPRPRDPLRSRARASSSRSVPSGPSRASSRTCSAPAKM